MNQINKHSRHCHLPLKSDIIIYLPQTSALVIQSRCRYKKSVPVSCSFSAVCCNVCTYVFYKKNELRHNYDMHTAFCQLLISHFCTIASIISHNFIIMSFLHTHTHTFFFFNKIIIIAHKKENVRE